MTFTPHAAVIARQAMKAIDPALVTPYSKLIAFLSEFPGAAAAMRGTSAPAIGSELYIQQQATAFASARKPRAPQPPMTVPDEMVSVVLHAFFDTPAADLARIQREHLLSMGAENLIGDLLERYLASVMEPRGWIWCSGSMVRAVDFVRPPEAAGQGWRLLQVKNRDNSENSSSSAIRSGTAIEKWFRTFSKKTGANWAAFPDTTLRPHLSEEGFESYVRQYLARLRQQG